MTTFQELYPLTSDGAILEAFFKDMEGARKGRGKGNTGALTSKVWADLVMLNQSDSVAFFTVVAHHPVLHVVLPECLEAAARSIVSTSKADRVPKASIQALSEIVIRIITGFSGSSGQGNKGFNMITFCTRLQKLFPPSSWLSLSHVLYRQHPTVATLVMNTLLLHLPTDLPSFKAIAMVWCDQIGLLVIRCTNEAKRGRFMRTNGDILALFEVAFRLSHEMWCLLEAAPIPVAAYLPFDHVIDGLSDLVNKISPLLQYFVLHSEELQSSRKRLSRANALIVNASIRASAIMTLFTPFITGNGEDNSKGTGFVLPRPVKALDESLSGQLLQYLPPTSLPVLLIKKCGSYMTALKQVVPLMASDDSTKGNEKGSKRKGGARRKITSDHNLTIFEAGSYRLGEVLVGLIKDASGSSVSEGGESQEAKAFGRSARFVELLLIELVGQGCRINDWVTRELVDDYESSLLGGSGTSKTSDATPPRDKKKSKTNLDDDFVPNTATSTQQDDDDAAMAAAIAASRAEAGLPPEEIGEQGTDANSRATTNPAVEMVLSVLPSFTAKQAEIALEYYSNNVENLIMDAVSENLPPHLVANAQSAEEKPKTAASAQTTSHTTNNKKVNFDDEEDSYIPPHLTMFEFLNEIDDGNEKGKGFEAGDVDFDFTEEGMGSIVYSSDMYFGGMGALGAMDDDLRHRTLLLGTEYMYDDERDDAVDADDEANRYLAGKLKGNEEEESDDEEISTTASAAHNHFIDPSNDDLGIQPAFDNRAVAGPGQKSGYQPKYTLKSTTYRVGGDSRNAHGGGKDPRDKKKEKPPRAAEGEGGQTGGRSGGGRGGGERTSKGGKLTKSNVAKLLKSGAL